MTQTPGDDPHEIEAVQREREAQARYEAWLLREGLALPEDPPAPKPQRPLAAGWAVLLYAGGTVLGLAGAVMLWMLLGIVVGGDHSNGVWVSVVTTVLFLIPIVGVFWLATWLVHRAKVGRSWLPY